MEMGMESPVMSTTVHQDIGTTILRFFLRLAVLFFLTIDVTAGLAYILISRSVAWRELIPLGTTLFCGISAGFLARWIYTGWHAFNRWLLACMAASGTLVMIGLASRQWLRVDLTGVSAIRVQPDFLELLSIACLTAFLAVFSWRKKAVMVEPKVDYSGIDAADDSTQMPAYSSPVVIHATAGESVRVSHKKRSFSIIPHGLRKKFFSRSRIRRWKRQMRNQFSSVRNAFEAPLRIFIPRGQTTSSSRRRTSDRLQIHVPEHRAGDILSIPTPMPRRRRGRRTPKAVKLIGKEDLRCPYCLQPVDLKDPKGVVICPICHAAHHKECWDITGSCQVPHNHAML